MYSTVVKFLITATEQTLLTRCLVTALSTQTPIFKKYITNCQNVSNLATAGNLQAGKKNIGDWNIGEKYFHDLKSIQPETSCQRVIGCLFVSTEILFVFILYT